MKLLGIAVIGKGNQPMYLCDCAKIAKEQGIETGSGTMTGDNNNNNSNDAQQQNDDTTNPEELQDYYEFGITPETVPASKVQGDSLCMDHQFMVHAALDRLEEIVGASKPDGSMPLRRNAFFSSWLGLLVVHDGMWAVYGHVTATNVKILALCEPLDVVQQAETFLFSETMTSSPNNSSSRSSAQPSDAQKKIKILLASIHQHYVDYIMNPFCDPAGPVESPKFDDNIRQSVAQYYDHDFPASIASPSKD
eukprot:CAMPEP_0198139332 /NCGR_PEP_ID=MMETSP1443-20131203/2664_1 /TAXON_ID=186043 /ORGANISM="Entomoneis sp., Strain CCMP2396" /LENGTH=249 /DNA_ID=CAMNT_0043801437 /DNA_START=68 /DNA_END=817 /DNA_ORIENTATION=+